MQARQVFRQLSPKAARGFTLVELLVVIAIIALLVSMLAACRSEGSRSSSSQQLYQQHEAAGISRP